MATKMCKFDGCPNTVDYRILGVCKTCYGGLAYWRGRSQTDKRKRQQQLTKLNSRMDHLIDHPRSVPRRKRQ